MKFRYDSYCGIYCGACEILNAFRAGRQEEKAKAWNFKPEDIRCYGCKSGDPSSWCNDCDFKECAENKQLDFCFECEEFPCDKLKKFQADAAAHHSSVLKNLHRIKKIGIKNWLTEQQKRWSCSECGAETTWYTEKCEKCGAELYNCILEEKDLNGG